MLTLVSFIGSGGVLCMVAVQQKEAKTWSEKACCMFNRLIYIFVDGVIYEATENFYPSIPQVKAAL